MALSTALCCIFCGFVSAAEIHIHAPENIAIVTGDPMTMSCGTDVNQSFVLWYFRSVVEDQDMLIFNGRRPIGLSRFTIDRNSHGLYQVRIENVTAFDAGTYRCVVRMYEMGGAETIAEFKSELIVLESHPSCGTNASSVMYDGHVDDILLLYCTVDYTGYWSPYMEWSRHDNTNVTTMPTIIQHNASTTSTLTLRLSPRDNSVTFSCKTAFAQSIEMKTSGIRNVPKYQYVWNHTINVLFGPQRIEITPRAESFSPNDSLYCAADGNPNPSCTWIDLDANKEVVKGCLLLIDENMRRDEMYNYQCRAENTVFGVKNVESTNITFRITGLTETWTLHQFSIIGMVVGTAVGSVLLLVIVTTIIRKRVKSKCRHSTSKVSDSQHDYESINDAEIPMTQLGRDSVTVIENIQEEDKDERGEEGERQEVEVNIIPPYLTLIDDAPNDSTSEVHSILVTEGCYSSLMASQIHLTQNQTDQYSQLDIQAIALDDAAEKSEQDLMVESAPQSYYNLQKTATTRSIKTDVD